MTNPVIDRIGNQRWYNSIGELHRTDGPAVLYTDGEQVWYFNGRLHRTDGPAYIGSDGTQELYINGRLCIDNKSYQKAAKLTDEEMLMIKIKYGNVK